MQLVLNTYGASLRRKNELIRIQAGDRSVELSPRKVESILILTGVHFSSDIIALALQHHVDILILDRTGTPLGRFWQTRMGSTAAIQLESDWTPTAGWQLLFYRTRAIWLPIRSCTA